MDKLIASITKIENVADGVVLFIEDFAKRLRNAATDPEKIEKLAKQLDDNSEKLAKAMTDNTAAAAEAPPAEPPAVEPTPPTNEPAA